MHNLDERDLIRVHTNPGQPFNNFRRSEQSEFHMPKICRHGHLYVLRHLSRAIESHLYKPVNFFLSHLRLLKYFERHQALT